MLIAIVSFFENAAPPIVIAAQRRMLERFVPRSRRHWRVRVLQKRISGVRTDAVDAFVRGERFDVVVVLGTAAVPLCEAALERIVDLAADGALVTLEATVASTTDASTEALPIPALFAASRATLERLQWPSLVVPAQQEVERRAESLGVQLALLSRAPRLPNAPTADGTFFALQGNTLIYRPMKDSSPEQFVRACDDILNGRLHPARATPEPLPAIYWINLDRSTERRARMQTRFAEQGLAHTRIAAVDGDDSDALTRAISAIGVSSRVAACSASHLTAIARAYADGCEQALIMEDDMTFELFTTDGWAQVHDALPERFGAVRLCVAETPRLLDKLYQERGTLRSVEKVYWCAGAYVIDRAGMHSVLSTFGFAPPFHVSHFAGEQSPEHLLLQTLKDDARIRGPFDARVPLFVFEALDSDVHPEEMPQYRRARAFIIEHHSALSAGRYRSPYPVASLARKVWCV